jgi:hypothetical protein
MAKRYYLSDIIGTGDEFDPYRPAVADMGVNWVGSIPTHPEGHPEHGRPVHTWALVLVAAKDHAAVRAHAGVDPLPDFPLDGKVQAINAATKGLMKAALTRRGLNADNLVDAKDGFREVVRGIGKAIDPVFDEDRFDITDV